jgi:hypothetical protein
MRMNEKKELDAGWEEGWCTSSVFTSYFLDISPENIYGNPLAMDFATWLTMRRCMLQIP